MQVEEAVSKVLAFTHRVSPRQRDTTEGTVLACFLKPLSLLMSQSLSVSLSVCVRAYICVSKRPSVSFGLRANE